MNEQRVECVDGQWKPVEPHGVPDGVLGQVMPGAMAEANEHNNQELWKQQKDPSYVPKFKHPEIIPVEGQEKEQKEEPVPDTGCTVLPAFPPWGCQQEAPEPAQETAAEESSVELVPDTMPGIWKLLGFTAESFYDLGTRTLPSAGKRKPGLEGSLKMYRKNMLLTVARALLMKEYDRKLTTEQVKKSVVASWRNNGRMKKYSDVIRENQGPATLARIKAILDEVDEYITGKVKSQAKYMIPYLGQLWCLKGFILWCKVSQGMTFKKTGWRSTKEK